MSARLPPRRAATLPASGSDDTQPLLSKSGRRTCRPSSPPGPWDAGAPAEPLRPGRYTRLIQRASPTTTCTSPTPASISTDGTSVVANGKAAHTNGNGGCAASRSKADSARLPEYLIPGSRRLPEEPSAPSRIVRMTTSGGGCGRSAAGAAAATSRCTVSTLAASDAIAPKPSNALSNEVLMRLEGVSGGGELSHDAAVAAAAAAAAKTLGPGCLLQSRGASRMAAAPRAVSRREVLVASHDPNADDSDRPKKGGGAAGAAVAAAEAAAMGTGGAAAASSLGTWVKSRREKSTRLKARLAGADARELRTRANAAREEAEALHAKRIAMDERVRAMAQRHDGKHEAHGDEVKHACAHAPNTPRPPASHPSRARTPHAACPRAPIPSHRHSPASAEPASLAAHLRRRLRLLEHGRHTACSHRMLTPHVHTAWSADTLMRRGSDSLRKRLGRALRSRRRTRRWRRPSWQ